MPCVRSPYLARRGRVRLHALSKGEGLNTMDEHQFTMLMKKLEEIRQALVNLQSKPDTFAEETRKLNLKKGVFGERF